MVSFWGVDAAVSLGGVGMGKVLLPMGKSGLGSILAPIGEKWEGENIAANRTCG